MDEMVVFFVGTPPLQGFKVDVNWYEIGDFVGVSGIIACSYGSFFNPLCSFEVSLGDVTFSPSFETFEGCSSQCGEV